MVTMHIQCTTTKETSTPQSTHQVDLCRSSKCTSQGESLPRCRCNLHVASTSTAHTVNGGDQDINTLAAGGVYTMYKPLMIINKFTKREKASLKKF